MCIRLVYYFIPCGHVEQDGWTCRNQYYNLFCDSPFLEQHAVNDESCTKCRLKALKRAAVLKTLKHTEVLDLDDEDEDEEYGARLSVEIARMDEDEENAKASAARSLMDMAGNEGEYNKITNTFKATKSNGVSKGAGGKRAKEGRETGKQFASIWDGHILGVAEHMRSISTTEEPESYSIF